MIRRGNFRVVCVSHEYPEQPYIFDLYINGTRAWPDRWFFGYYGTVGKDLFPFLLDKDGKIDFGSAYKRKAERFGSSNILEVDIDVGAKVLIRETSTGDRKPSNYQYRIKNIDNLDPHYR